jgi:hypothetical protein
MGSRSINLSIITNRICSAALRQISDFVATMVSGLNSLGAFNVSREFVDPNTFKYFVAHWRGVRSIAGANSVRGDGTGADVSVDAGRSDRQFSRRCPWPGLDTPGRNRANNSRPKVERCTIQQPAPIHSLTR